MIIITEGIGLGVSQHSPTYKRSRPEILGMRRGRGSGKTKLLFWQMSETKEPWEVEELERKKTMGMNEVETTSLAKRDME